MNVPFSPKSKTPGMGGASRVIRSPRQSAERIESLDELADSQRNDFVQTLADILTMEAWQADGLIAEYPEDSVDIRNAFVLDIAEHGEHTREWRSNTMALLPLQYWVPTDAQGCPHFVDDNPYASLKYLSHRETQNKKALQSLTNRRALHRALTERLPEAARARYAPLLDWDQERPARGTTQQAVCYPYLTDMRLSHLLYAVELMFDWEYGIAELTRRPAGLRPDQPTPPSLVRGLAETAASRVQAHMAMWNITDLVGWTQWDMGVEVAGELHTEPGDIGQRGHLVLWVLCSLTANRELLERSRLRALADIGAQANCTLLEALNRNGIEMAPEPGDYAYDLPGIRAILLKWFGPGGVLAGDPVLPLPLKGQDLEVVLAQAENIQDQYIHSRGHLSPDQYRSDYDRFLFALAVTACHVAKIKLPDEFLAGKQKPVIPARNLGERRMELVSPEALELMKAMYGQLLYGNEGTRLDASGVQQYAENFRLRHAHLQELLFNMFKRLSPSQLLHFDGVMMRMTNMNESGLEQENREATSRADRRTRFQLALAFYYQVPG
ncbi:hypothetical protein ACFQVB_27660 [Paraburkholderia humisilvae]|uniref:hypothetical protein n=1 Tax=Paraburkholderia humisilvae TaxID=627669 RepID=UPI0036151F3C